jgi:hypothetical protein
MFGFSGTKERSYHKDGSYTDRNETTGDSTTYDADGRVREFSLTHVPLIGPTHVTTYNSDGEKVNTTYPEK